MKFTRDLSRKNLVVVNCYFIDSPKTKMMIQKVKEEAAASKLEPPAWEVIRVKTEHSFYDEESSLQTIYKTNKEWCKDQVYSSL
jgi:hypothetical protein